MTATWTANKTWAAGEVVTAAMLNQYVRNNLDWLKGRPYVSEQDFDGTFFSTSSSSFQYTNANTTLTTTGGRVMVVVFGTIVIGNTATSARITLYEDGVNKGDATEGMVGVQGNTGFKFPFCIIYITPTAPTAAAHDWRIYLRSTNNTDPISFTQYQMWAIEIGA